MKSSSSSQPTRLASLDLLRGIAVLMMIFSHSMFDLRHFAKREWIEIAPSSPDFWFYFPKFTGGLFLFVSGVSFSVWQKRFPEASFKTFSTRLFKLLFWASILTALTLLMTPGRVIYFGILHCLATSSILLYVLRKNWRACFYLSLPTMILGFYWIVHRPEIETPFFLPFGWIPFSYRGGDYFPLFPWFGVVCLGFALDHLLYVQTILAKPFWNFTGSRWVQMLGRHSLIIYILHQPLLFGLMYVLHLLDTTRF